MSQTHRPRRALALGAGLVACSLSPVTLGTVSQYTTYASWTGIPGSSIVGVETFNGFSYGYQASPAGGTAGSVGWSAAATGGLFFSDVASSRVLSTNLTNTTITLSFLAVGGVSGVAGSFFATDLNFGFLAGDLSILVTLNDSSTQSFTRTMTSEDPRTTTATRSSIAGRSSARPALRACSRRRIRS